MHISFYFCLQVASRHTEYYLHWCWNLLHTHGAVLLTVLNSMAHLESVRALIRAISTHEREIMRMSDENVFSLAFLNSQMVERSPEDFAPEVALIENDEGEEEVHEEVEFSIDTTSSAAPVSPAAVSTPVVEEMEVVTEAVEEAPVSAKKSSKKSKKLTIQTLSAEKTALSAAAIDHAAVVEVEAKVRVEEDAAVIDLSPPQEEADFATPNKKKDKKSAKSATKSLLKSVSKYGRDEELTATGNRVTFSHPLSKVKIISPNQKSKFLGIPASAQIEEDEENVRSASKKRLWADEDA